MTSAVKEREDFKTRERINDEVRDFICGERCTTELLTDTCTRQQQLSLIDTSDKMHCKNILSKENHHERRRHTNTLIKCAENMHNDKCYDSVLRAAGVEYAPLLIGKVQIGKITIARRELAIE